MREEDAKMRPNKDCVCDSRALDNIEKKVIMQEIQIAYEKIILPSWAATATINSMAEEST